MSGFESKTIFNAGSKPLKSGVSTSTVHPGLTFLVCLIVSAQIEAPKSPFKSSLSTEVITTCLKPIFLTACATLIGSKGSFQVGLPVLTEQNPQARVHVSPKIISVAVFLFQHS